MKTRSAFGNSSRRRLGKAIAGTILCLAALIVATTLIWPAAKPAAKPGAPGTMTAEEIELQRQVREIGLKLRAPCCPELTLAQHDSPQTMAIKKEIAQMLKEGKGQGEIIRAMKAKYGDEITGGAAANLSPALWIGGSIVGLLILLLISRWMMRHEKEPMHLDEGHWMEEQAEKAAGDGGVKKAS